jgi:hypothetical protein
MPKAKDRMAIAVTPGVRARTLAAILSLWSMRQTMRPYVASRQRSRTQ